MKDIIKIVNNSIKDEEEKEKEEIPGLLNERKMIVKTKQVKKSPINNSGLTKLESTTPEEIKENLRTFINHEKKISSHKKFLPHKYNSVVPPKSDKNSPGWKNKNPFNPNENNNNNNN
jgi:hypothetical protein